MALKNCFQVSSVSTPRVGFVQSHHCSFPSKEKLNLSTCTKAVRGLQLSKPSKNGRSSFVCKAGKAVDEVKVVTDTNWNDMVISSGTPVLVEFWAPWCGPCRMIAPVIDELAKEYSGKIACFKLNTDDCPSIATKYGIRSIPTVLVFKQGEKKESVIGAVPKSTLTSTIEKYIDA